ncbi:uncharacterized protein LOC107490475 [Arachis duranensis]|uniref:Uncharacterized protein LOC107490475 n=1 Tax=Arachis duranensis TaxID=130453 RepID=A0A6P4DM54_ARADU|nr:uncharacterized protein LOC107490475 [Arachis duranensis]
MYGDEKKHYMMVRDYGLTLLKANPGSTIQIATIPQPDGTVIFDIMYVCLSGCRDGFKAGCRPLIGLDDAFLKTQFGGQILSAVGQDANHHIYVIAWGLVPAMQEVMPRVHHRFCVWYLWRNFNKNWKDLELRGLLWECARATTFQEFRDTMNKIKRISEDAWAYLNKWPRDSWTKCQFSHKPKLDSICNNACEVFNSKIKEARAKPIITLLEEVRMFVMRTIARNKVKLSNHVGKLPPVIKSILEKVRKESKNWHPIWTGNDGYEKFEVHGYSTNHVVDLGKKLCTCQFWMLTGIPCVHACAALSRVNKSPDDFCHPLVTMESYKATYNHHINPIPGQLLWEVSEFNKPRAPKVKRPPEKLKMKRRMDSDEKHGGGKRSRIDIKNNDNTHLKRQLGKFTCSYCGDKGHTKRGCKKKRLADAAVAAAATVEAATKNSLNKFTRIYFIHI